MAITPFYEAATLHKNQGWQKEKISLILSFFLLLLSLNGSAKEQSSLKPMEKFDSAQTSFAIGQDMAQGYLRRKRALQKIGLPLNNESLLKGFKAALDSSRNTEDNHREKLYSEQQLKAIIYEFERQIQKQEAKAAQQEAIRIRESYRAFYQEYKKRYRAEELGNGILVRKIRNGTGHKPSIRDKIIIRFRVSLTDGTIVEDRLNRNVEINLSQALSGWQLVLSEMSIGSKWQVMLPPETAWGSSRHGNIPADSILICDFELFDIL